MKIKVFLYSILSALIFISCNSSGGGEYDTRAVESLDKLTETIGKLTSLSYSVDSYSIDEEGKENDRMSDVYLKGSYKMFVENTGSEGNPPATPETPIPLLVTDPTVPPT